MSGADWIALITPGTAGIAAATAFIVKLTRLIVAVEALADAVRGPAGLASQASDHERRLRGLESRRRR